MRGFEVVSRKIGFALNTPKRSTEMAGGYDFEASDAVIVPSMWKTFARMLMLHGTATIGNQPPTEAQIKMFSPVLVKTGIKAYMPKGETLDLYNRSSNPGRGLYLANAVGIVDKDFVDNEKNEGEICFAFINLSLEDVEILPGDRIGQGVFHEFKTVDGDNATGKRTGGFGSTSLNPRAKGLVRQ